MMIKNVKFAELNISIATVIYKPCYIQNCYILEYTNFKDDLIEYKCLCCKKNIYESLIKS